MKSIFLTLKTVEIHDNALDFFNFHFFNFCFDTLPFANAMRLVDCVARLNKTENKQYEIEQ